MGAGTGAGAGDGAGAGAGAGAGDGAGAGGGGAGAGSGTGAGALALKKPASVCWPGGLVGGMRFHTNAHQCRRLLSGKAIQTPRLDPCPEITTARMSCPR